MDKSGIVTGQFIALISSLRIRAFGDRRFAYVCALLIINVANRSANKIASSNVYKLDCNFSKKITA
jgi:hypothetical protein